MRLPRSLALPAELSFTCTTHHVITATVLLNGGVALWTLLGVAVNPIGRFTIVITLLQPTLQILTEDGFVGVAAATETERNKERLQDDSLYRHELEW